jgi:hypothetical protein
MTSCRYSLIVVSLLLIQSCGVKLDLSNLSFQDAGVDTMATDGTASDLPNADVTGVDLVAPDDGRVDPDNVASGPSCWETFNCVIFEQKSITLEDIAFQKCGAPPGTPEYTVEMSDLRDCLDICMVSETKEELFSCLFKNCIGQTLMCMNEDGGSRTCADALLCSVKECKEQTGPEGSETDCAVDCYLDMAKDEIDKLIKLVEECVFKAEAENTECIPATEACYAGSGDKTCLQVLSCLSGCNTCTQDPGEEPSDEPCSSEECLTECMYGISEDGAQLIGEVQACVWDEEQNVFGCLESALTCYHDTINGSTPCKGVLGSIKPFYDAILIDQDVRFGTMLVQSKEIKNQETMKLIGAYKCLGEKWNIYPGYGAIPDADWNACVAMCN